MVRERVVGKSIGGSNYKCCDSLHCPSAPEVWLIGIMKCWKCTLVGEVIGIQDMWVGWHVLDTLPAGTHRTLRILRASSLDAIGMGP